MSTAELMTDLARLGIRIEAHGDRLRYSPRSGVTPDLADRMKAHKGELLAILRRDPEAGKTDEGIEVIAPPDPCPKCGTLELWQSLASNWRCLRCDPPTKARRLRERAARLKTDRTDSPRMNARGDP